MLTLHVSWGESSGAISVSHHMLANGGDTQGLFRAGFMESGSPCPVGFIDEPYLQDTYDNIVKDTGCGESYDTLSCLLKVPADILKAAMDKTPAFAISFQVRVSSAQYQEADSDSTCSKPMCHGSPGLMAHTSRSRHSGSSCLELSQTFPL